MTLDEAKQVLEGMGVEPPEFIIQGWLDLFATVQDCLDAHYTEATQKLLLASLIGLYGLSGGGRYVSSQTAPSGASQSFRYGDFKVMWKSTLGQLRLLDTHGCLTKLIPANPSAGNAFLGVGKGGCYE